MPVAPPILDQSFHVVASFALENGVVLRDVPVAYKTWGRLNEARDNVMVICHAFTGSADVEDWWGPLMGRGKAFDPNRFFIFCANVLGSPYGTASPVTLNPDTGRPYGPEFPPTSIRDDVRLHKHVLDHLGVTSVAVVIGGSMGGMAVLEWPLCSPPGYVRHIVPLATSARHSAWCISWGETQRQSIYSDPGYEDGYYTAQPASGLAAARMAALLTYRSRDSFESRFGRRPQAAPARTPEPNRDAARPKLITPLTLTSADHAVIAHNEGHQRASRPSSQAQSPNQSPTQRSPTQPTQPHTPTEASPQSPAQTPPHSPPSDGTRSTPPTPPPIFSAQSYLRYQGAKFVARFDANCYIHITRKLDTHDIARGRRVASTRYANPNGINGHDAQAPNGHVITTDDDDTDTDTDTDTNTNTNTNTDAHPAALPTVLVTLPARALIISIETDGLFTPSEQRQLATHIPGAELVVIPSPDGHDGFLLEFERINAHVLAFLKREFPAYYYYVGGEGGGGGDNNKQHGAEALQLDDFVVKKTSLFGEAEADVTRW